MKVTLDYLFPLKAGMISKRYDSLRRADRKLSTATVENAIIIPPLAKESKGCCVIDSEGKLVEFSCHEPDESFLEKLSDSNFNPDCKIEGKALFAGYFNPHWGHFITDTLSRLWPLFRSPALEVDKIIFCVHSGDKSDFSHNVRRILSFLEIDGKIEFISEPTKIDTIVVPEIGIYPREIFATAMIGVYDRIVEASMRLPEEKKFGNKIYMSRSQLPKARNNEAGLDIIDQWMKDNRYDVIYPEQMDIADLVHALQGAEEVAAISGTLPHNMLFGRNGARLLIIEKYPTLNNYQPGVDLLRNLDVTMVDCGAFIRPVSPGLGPFIVYPTSLLDNYAGDRKMIPAPRMTGKRIRKHLRLFFKMFRRHYHEQWIVPEWLTEELALCSEAYGETNKTYGPWLNGSRFISVKDAFNLRRMAKWSLNKLRKIF